MELSFPCLVVSIHQGPSVMGHLVLKTLRRGSLSVCDAYMCACGCLSRAGECGHGRAVEGD